MIKFILKEVAAVTSHLLNMTAEQEIASLSLVSGLGLLFWGPGGHAKSAFAESVTDALVAGGCDARIKAVNSGTKVDELKGGVDLAALSNEKKVKFFYQNSPLNCNLLVVDEILDMSATVTAAFKPWITSKSFQDGNEKFPLPLNLVWGLTNKEPAEVAAQGAWISALLERFPLQYKSCWESYKSEDFQKLFAVIANPQIKEQQTIISWERMLSMQTTAKKVQVPNSVAALLSQLIADAIQKGSAISPRTAVYAMQLAKAAAVIDGKMLLSKEHLTVVKYLPGLEQLGKDIEKEIQIASDKAVAIENFSVVKESALRLVEDSNAVSVTNSLVKCMQYAKALKVAVDNLATMKIPDFLNDNRKQLREVIEKRTEELKTLAILNTNIDNL